MVPLVLLNVHTVVPQFECVAVNRNVFVPDAERTSTPVVALNPATVGLAPPTHAEDDVLYAELAAKYASSATAALRKSDLTWASWPRFR